MRPKTLLPITFAVLLASLLTLGGCGKTDTRQIVVPDSSPLFDGLSFGTNDTFDIVTWNLHEFPSSSLSVHYVAQAVRMLTPEVVAFQEIGALNHSESTGAQAFAALLDSLVGWAGYRATDASGSDQNLAMIWNEAEVTADVPPYEIFQSERAAFPRPPLVLECTVRGQPLIIVDNHFKCCGNGIIDETDPWDEEYRRLLAVQNLDQWVRDEHPDNAVIILGDMNDKLTDSSTNNVFEPFLLLPDEYRFADMQISAASGIDHILVTNELFSRIDKDTAEAATLHPDTYLDNGWNEYRENVSDHLPVALKFPY